MAQMSKFYDDNCFLQAEHELLTFSAMRIQELKSSQSQRHIKEGFDVRLLMMQECRIFMRENTQAGNSLSACLWTKLCIYLNAYYLNLRGALDNLAWALNYQFNLFLDVTESSKKRGKCSLFNCEFQSQIETISLSLAGCLRSNKEWHSQLADLRDPAAHRIPLTPVAGVIVGEDQLAEFRRLEALSARPREELQGLPRSYYLREAQKIANYQPIFTLSSGDSQKTLDIPTQVAFDHERFLMIATGVFQCLWGSPSA